MDQPSVSQGLAKIETTSRDWPNRPGVELVLCIVGSFLSTYAPAIGTSLMVAGVWLLSRAQEGRRVWGILGCLVPLAILSVVSWVDLGSLALPSVVCALVIALALPGRISVTSVCLVIVGVTALMMGIDEWVLLGYGTDIVASVTYTLDTVASQMTTGVSGTSSSVVVSAAVEESINLMRKVWPLLYMMQGAAVVLLGLVALVVVRRIPYIRLERAYLQFRVPLWGVVLLVLAAASWIASVRGLEPQVVFESFALCVLIVLRVLFFLQGFSCILFFLETKGYGTAARVAGTVLALLLEYWFFAVCVFGCLDCIADFRHLARHGGEEATREDETRRLDAGK